MVVVMLLGLQLEAVEIGSFASVASSGPAGGAWPAGLGPPGANSGDSDPNRPEAIDGLADLRPCIDRGGRGGHFLMLGALFGPLVDEIRRPERRRRHSGVTGPYTVNIDVLGGADHGGTVAVAVRALVRELWWGEDFDFSGGTDFVPAIRGVRRGP